MTRTPDRPAVQLHLGLPNRTATGADDFLAAAPNALALAAIRSELPGGLLLLTGPEGSGKTHLAAIWAGEQGAAWLDCSTLSTDLPRLLRDPAPVLALDDADAVAGTDGEEALFHLLNHLRGRGRMVMTARRPVRDWGVALPDLESRLAAITQVPVSQPDETLLAAVMVKMFNDRQVQVAPALIDYLLTRIERSFAAAQETVTLLDQESLRRKKPITRALAHEVLAEQAEFSHPEPDA